MTLPHSTGLLNSFLFDSVPISPPRGLQPTLCQICNNVTNVRRVQTKNLPENLRNVRPRKPPANSTESNPRMPHLPMWIGQRVSLRVWVLTYGLGNMRLQRDGRISTLIWSELPPVTTQAKILPKFYPAM